MKLGIVHRLWLAVVVVVLVTLLALSIALGQLLEDFYLDQRAADLISDGQHLADMIAAGESQRLGEQLELMRRMARAEVMIIDAHGMVTACDTMMGMRPGMPLDMRGLEDVFRGQTLVRQGTHPGLGVPAMLYAAVPIMDSDRRVHGAVMLFTPLASIAATTSAMRRLVALAALAAVLLATVLSFFLSRRISQPLLAIKNAALAMAGGDFSRRVAVTRGDEVGDLAQVFNHLSAELAGNIEELSREKEKLDGVVASMSDGLLTLDEEGRLLLYNRQAEGLLGGGLVTGCSLPETAGRPEIEGLLRAALEEQAPRVSEFRLGNRVLAARVAPLKSHDTPTRGAVVVLQDITREREAERRRQEFLASISHELRTPLSFIQGYTEALQDGVAGGKAEEEGYLDIILGETKRLRRLVDDLMDLSKLEAGQLRLEMEPLDLVKVVAGAVRSFEQRAREKEVTLSLNPRVLAGLVQGDESRLAQVLFNLLENALRYSPRDGKVQVEVRRRGGELLVTVADQGPGIDPGQADRVWESFYRVDKARSRAEGGSGLGLAVVKRIVEAHGGRIGLESTPGQGSTFFFALPALE